MKPTERYQDGFEHGAIDASAHRDYDMSLTGAYGYGYDAGYEHVATDQGRR